VTLRAIVLSRSLYVVDMFLESLTDWYYSDLFVIYLRIIYHNKFSIIWRTMLVLILLV